MIEFLDITLRNFMSYGNIPITIQLGKQGTTLIQGEDLDNADQGLGGNGTGKTSLVQAIIYALYDRVTRDISKDELINNVNKKNLEVVLNFKKNNTLYTIKRCRKSKSGGDGNYTEILKDGVDVTPAGSTAINNEIVNILGIPYELFVRVVTFTTRQTSFLSLPTRSSSGPNQTDLIEELFQLKQLSCKAELLKEHTKENEKRLKDLIDKFNHSKNEHERIAHQVDVTRQRVEKWDTENTSQILSLHEKLQQYQSIDFDNERTLLDKKQKFDGELSQLNTETKSLQQALQRIENQKKAIESKIKQWDDSNKQESILLLTKQQKFSSIDFGKQRELLLKRDELLQTIKSINDGVKNTSKEISDIKNNRSKKADELSHLDDAKCPYCKQDYKDTTIKIQECNDTIDAYDKQLSILQTQLNDLKHNLKIKTDELDNVVPQLHTDSLVKLVSIENEYNNLDELITKNKNNTNPYVSELAVLTETNEYELITKSLSETHSITQELQHHLLTLPSSIFKNTEDLLSSRNNLSNIQLKIDELSSAVNPHNDTLNDLIELSKTLDVLDSTEIDKLTNYIEHQKFLYKLLTKKDSFVRKTLLNKNIPFLNRQLSKYLKDLGLPHTVEFTHEMTAKISQFGRELSFSNLSGGQEARVNIALSLAFRDVLQNMHECINICLFDEILDVGLDSVGVTLAAKLLKKKAREEKLSLFVVSHRDEINSMFDHKMIVQYTNGFSYIKVENE